MTDSKKSNNIDSQDDTEFGFPFSELVPLAVNSEPLYRESPIEKIEQVDVEDKFEEQNETMDNKEDVKLDVTAEVVPIAEDVSNTVLAEAEPKEIKRKSQASQTTTKKKKSKGPLILILILLMLLILSVMAYFLYYLPSINSKAQIANTELQENSETEQSEITPGNTDGLITTDGSEQEEEVVLSTQEPVKAQSAAELILIKSRASNPRYFVVVASVISERSARREADKILGKEKNTWIVFPYGNIRNYRIAVGQFDNIETATKAWENGKSEFGNTIWILKY